MGQITLEHFEGLLEKENVSQRKTFGMPSLFVNGNMFLAVTKDGVGYKLDDVSTERALSYEGAQPMQLRGWTEVPFTVDADWRALAEDAFAFVSTLSPKKKK